MSRRNIARLMRRLWTRCLIAVLCGAAAGAGAVEVRTAVRPALVFEMDREFGSAGRGFFAPELAGDETFVWTSGAASLALPGLDRSGPWRCSLRLRAPRPDGSTAPVVEVAADGVAVSHDTTGPAYEDREFTIPARPAGAGVTLSLRTAPAFVPGPQDKRELGAQLDRLSCSPAGARTVVAPRSTLSAAAAIGAMFGLTFALAGPSLVLAIAGAVLLAIVQAEPLTIGIAPFVGYASLAARLAAAILAPAALLLLCLRAIRRPFQPAGGFVIAFTAAIVFLKLIALLHPAKFPVDVVFHAHRLEWVLDGRFYFSQGLRDAQFPYAIALYVFAAPWAALTGDHVLLLRVVVCVVQAIAASLLYLVIVRRWKNHAVGALAVVLFHLAPLPYIILGNANLTYAFGQSAGVAAMAAATIWALGSRQFLQWTGLFAISSIAFLSHIGTFPLTLGALLMLSLLCLALGGREMRTPAIVIAAMTTAAVIFSVAIYWGHFSEVYATFDRVLGRAPAVAAAALPPGAPTPRLERLRAAGTLSAYSYGWPLLLAAIAGLVIGLRVRCRDRAGLAIAAWLTTCAGAVAASVLMPIDRSFERYADEFITRAYDATMPAVAILGAVAIVQAWRGGVLFRVVGAAVLAGAALRAYQQWIAWLT